MKQPRRKLNWTKLPETVDEMQRLLEHGYVQGGNWTLGQIACHMRKTVAASIDGYPWWMSVAAPLRPLIRRLMLGKLLRGDSPAGLPTAGMFVPPMESDDAAEVAEYEKTVARFLVHDGPYFPHPGFGRLKPDVLQHFHAMHAAHHLGFLSDATVAD